MEPSKPAAEIAPAGLADAATLIELLLLRPPAYWMRTAPRAALDAFAAFAVESPRAVVLLARASDDPRPAGYIFATVDPRRFWFEFGLRRPLISHGIVARQLLRRRALRRAAGLRAGGDGASLPAFEWSPSDPANARILGLFVRPEHRRRGIAMALYLRLFEALKARGVAKVEEYMGPDYPEYAGKFPDACGWDLRECRCGGYKITKTL